MRIWKIVSGILSIAISAFVLFQSLFAGLWNTVSQNGQSSGAAGVVVAVTLLAGGIVSLIAHNGNLIGDVAMSSLYGIGGVVGFLAAGDFADLRIWALWALLCAVVAMVDIALAGRADQEEAPAPKQQPAAARSGPATLQDIVLEEDPQRRNAAIDALPEWTAKSYLKQVLNIFLSRGTADEQEGSGLVQLLAAVLVTLGILAAGAIGLGVFLSSSGNQPAASSPSPAGSSPVRESSPAHESPSQPVGPSTAEGTLGDYEVQIIGAFIAEDFEGNPALIVTYSWTNNSEKTTSAMVAFSEKAFQNGVQIDRAVVYSRDTPGYDSGTSTRDIRPGASTEVQCAFTLRDRTAVVEFELSELISLSDDIVSVNFDPAALSTAE